MGGKQSKQDTAPLHLTLYLPVFGTPNHIESFIISSTVPYPDDPLFGAFVLSPFFDQVANKLSNQQFLDKHQITPRYQENYRQDKTFFWNHELNIYEALGPHLRRLSSTDFNLIEFNPAPQILPQNRDPDKEPEGFHFRPKRLDFDTTLYPVIMTQTNPSMTKSNPPSHVPFFKIGLPLTRNLPREKSSRHEEDDIVLIWCDELYPYQYLHTKDTDQDKVLPFKGLGVGQDFGRYEFEMDRKKPYHGLGGDGTRTEFDIFSGYKYPRKSVVDIRALDGYSLNKITHLTHIDTIPAHHVGTILILDMVCESSIRILAQFLTQTLSHLQRGCILPLINVDIWVLQVNADKLDSVVMNNDFILERLNGIGFSFDHIHLCPYEISPFYNLPPPNEQRPQIWNDHLVPPAFPLLSKSSLTHFLAPIWDAVYLKTFQLHQDGHWDRLAERSIKNNPKFIPPHIFPTDRYLSLDHPFDLTPDLLKLQFNEAIKGYTTRLNHEYTNGYAIAQILSFAAMYRTFQIKALEYLGPVQSPPLHSSNQLQPAYELLFKGKEPSWDDPRTYFPHIKTLGQFITNPTPLRFDPRFDSSLHNNDRPLPIQYNAHFVKKTTKSIGDNSQEEENGSFPAQTSIWPIATTTNNSTAASIDEMDSTRNTHNSNETNHPISQPLSNQILSLGLPKRYEFESFILWSDRTLIADQSSLYLSGYFYEPHVQNEVIQAVNRVKLEQTQENTSSHNAPNPSPHPISPQSILKALLPPNFSKTPSPTPFQYLLFTAPNQILSAFSPSTEQLQSAFSNTVSVIRIILQKRINDLVFSRILSRLVGHLHLLREDQHTRFHERRIHLKIQNTHMIPPILRHRHYTTIVPLTYAHTRVEIQFIGAESSTETNNIAAPTQKLSPPVDISPATAPPSIEIGLTYLHRGVASATVNNDAQDPKLFYASHPLVSSTSFLPLAWLHGVFIFPFVYISSRTKTIHKKLHHLQQPVFLSRSIGQCPYPTTETSPTFGSYPQGFIPPPIPSLPPPADPWSMHGIAYGAGQDNYASKILGDHNSQNSDLSEKQPFTIPLPPPEVTRLRNLLVGPHDPIIIDPCRNTRFPSGPNLAQYHSPMTFIILISNPIHPDPIPYRNLDVPHQTMGCDDLTPLKPKSNDVFAIKLTSKELKGLFFADVPDESDDIIPFTDNELNGNELDGVDESEEEGYEEKSTKTSNGALDCRPSLLEPITQSQFRYYQEYIPVMYKRQLTEKFFGHGLCGGTRTKLEKLWSVEVHTPQSLKAAMKRLETSAIETRLKLYRDLALCLQHDEQPKN